MSKRIRVADGVCAVWDDASDTDPFTDPLDNLSRVKFHSELDYIKIIEEHTVTLNLPLISGVRLQTASYTLFAHGRSGQPFILGGVEVNGEFAAFTGSVPVQMGTPNSFFNIGGYYGRWLALGADATNVYIYEYAVVATADRTSDFWETYPALSLPITVWITDEILES